MERTHKVISTAYPCGTLITHPSARMPKPEPLPLGEAMKKSAHQRAKAMHKAMVSKVTDERFNYV